MINGLPVKSLPRWVPDTARRYLKHTETGLSIRVLARDAGCYASTVLRQIRKVESRRDDPLVDAALSATMDEEALREVYMHVFMTVDLNTAAEEDLKLIPSSLSARKLAHEVEEYRPYASVEQFEREMSKYVSDEEVAYLKRYVYLAE